MCFFFGQGTGPAARPFGDVSFGWHEGESPHHLAGGGRGHGHGGGNSGSRRGRGRREGRGPRGEQSDQEKSRLEVRLWGVEVYVLRYIH